MNGIYNKNIILGVTGGIAAYKSAFLLRALKNAGANVKVVMTNAAREFMTALTFQALSGQPVPGKLLNSDTANSMEHIELARWADAIMIAPATANFIARLASGRVDDLLTAVCLASEATLAIAPAMNSQMWQDNKTIRNVENLEQSGILVFGPAAGIQACDESGPGRMLEPDQILRKLADSFKIDILSGKKILITAGPTYETIDPVRFVGNKSSGKMGYALAQAAIEFGAKVELISGPSVLQVPDKVKITKVTSAAQMLDAVLGTVTDCDWLIGAAAVADYSPVKVSKNKLKKTADELVIKMQRNPDILLEARKAKKSLFMVGFAAETQDLVKNAKAKLSKKNIDVIVANKVGTHLGFDTDDNAVTLIWPAGKKSIKRMHKTVIARKILTTCQKIASGNI